MNRQYKINKRISGSEQQYAGYQHSRFLSDILVRRCAEEQGRNVPQSKIRNSTYYGAAFSFFLIMILSCAHHTVFDRIENGDFSMVHQGRYDHPARFLDAGGEYSDQVLDIRRVIEKHVDLMPLIAQQYYNVGSDRAFTFKYALLDTVNHCFVLRYFTRTHHDPLLAGYQIFFVYDTETGDIPDMYTSEVPLE